MAEVGSVRGMDSRFDSWLNALQPLILRAMEDEFLARPASELMARAVQGAQLLLASTPDVVDAFMATRLGAAATGAGAMFGAMGMAVSKAQAGRIVERAAQG